MLREFSKHGSSARNEDRHFVRVSIKHDSSPVREHLFRLDTTTSHDHGAYAFVTYPLRIPLLLEFAREGWEDHIEYCVGCEICKICREAVAAGSGELGTSLSCQVLKRSHCEKERNMSIGPGKAEPGSALSRLIRW
jgi:hypothetical protein